VATGENNQDIPLTPSCQGGGGGVTTVCVANGMTLGQRQFWPAKVTTNYSLCPSCRGASDFEQSIECGESQLQATTSSYSWGATQTNAYVDTAITRRQVRNEGRAGLECLTNDPSKDTIDPASHYPTGPIQIIAGSGPLPGKLVSTSQSIANFPIIDSSTAITVPPGDVRIIGFLQGFIETITPGGSPLSITVKILNITGCGNNPGGTSVQAGGTSAVAVRLISQ
jgi:hypothetical protein